MFERTLETVFSFFIIDSSFLHLRSVDFARAPYCVNQIVVVDRLNSGADKSTTAVASGSTLVNAATLPAQHERGPDVAQRWRFRGSRGTTWELHIPVGPIR